MVVIGSSDGLIRVILVFLNKILGFVGEYSDMFIECLIMSFDKNMFVLFLYDKMVKLWKVDWLTEEGAWDDVEEMDVEEVDDDDDSDDDGKFKK